MMPDNSQVQSVRASPVDTENRVKKSRPSPFMGAASIVLKTGGAVLGLIAKSIGGAVSLLRPKPTQTESRLPRKMNDPKPKIAITDADNNVIRPRNNSAD